MIKRILQYGYLLLIIVFLYLPILIIILQSFQEARYAFGESWGFRWYRSLWENKAILRAFWVTITIAITSALTATLIGFLGAWWINQRKSYLQKTILFINKIPVVSPDIVLAIGFLSIILFLKIPLGFYSLFLAHVAFNIPYTVILILPRLRSFSQEYSDAALDLGASEWTIFWRIFLPYLFPTLLSAIFLAISLSLDDFIISFFVTGRGVQTVSILTYVVAKKGINPALYALNSLFFLFIFISILAFQFFQTNKGKKKKLPF